MSRWVVLAVGTLAQTSQAAVFAGLAVLAPALRDRYDLGLGEIGVLLGGSGVGAMVTLLPWGLAADRLGERVTGTTGLAGAAGALAAAAFAPSFVWLVVLLALAGAFGAATNSATGRAVMGWFGRRERGLALAVRQTAVPIGGVAAAVGLPPVVSSWGTREALLALAAGSAVSALAAALVLREGPADQEEGAPGELLRHPLRDRRIWRLSVGSSLLVWPQLVMLGFVVVFLEDERGFSTAGAAAVLAGINVVGGVGRLASGRVSDRLGRRIAPLRGIAGATALGLAAVAALISASPWLLCPALVAGGGLAMSWNALSFAAAAETAGRARSGAAVGLQQTALSVTGALTPLAFAPLVDATSWRAGFAAAAAVPVLAILVLRPLEP